MKVHARARPIVAALALSLVAGCGSEKSPEILSFAANPLSVDAGGTAVLEYRVRDAETVRIEVQGGAIFYGPLTQLEGATPTPPIDRETTFVLTAFGASTSVTRAVTVRLRSAMSGEATILELSADPLTVEPGGSTTLSWRTEKAIAGVVRVDGETIHDIPTGELSSGSLRVDAVTRPTLFTLAVAGEDGIETTAGVAVVLTGGGPMVAAFEATPNPITRGGSALLSWSVVGATEVSITGNLTGAVYAGPNVEGALQVSPRFTELYTLVASNAEGETAIVTEELRVNPPPGADILSFTATPDSTFAGQPVTLAWVVDNAPEGVVIERGASVLTSTSATSGSYVDRPFSSTIYTLRAINRTLGDARASVTVVVDIPPGARILAFEADRDTVSVGEGVALTWSVENAPEGIVLTDPSGAELLTETATSGAMTVFPDVSGDYSLRARNDAQGDATASLPVTVLPSAPAIVRFESTPASAAVAGSTVLSWEAPGAERVVIQRAGTLVYDGPLARGSVSAQVGGEDARFSLVATNSLGTATSELLVRVFGPPRITQFLAMPYFTQQPALNVNLVWVTNDTQDVELYVDGVPTAVGRVLPQHLAAIGVGAGNTPVMVNHPTLFELVARNPAGTSIARARVAMVTGEVEPNDGQGAAIPLAGDGSGVTGAITPTGDEDWYSVQVPEGGSLRAETSDGLIGCAMDTILELYDSGGNLLEADDDTGAQVANVAGCSVIDGQYDPGARDLSAGTYYLKVASYPPSSFLTSVTGNYAVTVRVRAPACGDGVRQTDRTPPEACDDGNLIPGDGCSDACENEALREFGGPGTTWELPATLRAAQTAWYRIELASAGYIRAETYTAPGVCAGADTILHLYDGAGVELAMDDDAGILSCSLIEAGPASPALPPGEYWLTVEDRGHDEPIRDYVLSLVLAGVGCGNGRIDGAEGCDDGNTAGGDGCSATCGFEGRLEAEGAGNNAPTGQGVLVSTGSEELQGSLSGTGDEDWYALTVPSGDHLDAFVTIQSLSECPDTGASVRVALFDQTLRQLAVNTGDGPGPSCGRISPSTTDAAFSMAGGTYYLRVDEVDGDAGVPRYYLHVRLSSPECGNSWLEAGEECDFGDRDVGDGCDATCAFEPGPIQISVPGGNVPLGFARAGAAVVVPVVTTAQGQAIDAVAADPGGTACELTNTSIELRDATYSLLGFTSGGGPEGAAGTCGAIQHPDDAWGADLPTGTYFIVVYAEGEPAGASELRVAIENPACGNGLVETQIDEQCDDGNSASNDGCSSACRLEPEAQATAPTASPVVFAGQLQAVGDRNAYRLTVTGASVFLYAETFAPTAAAGCNADTVLRVYDGAFVLIGEDDEGGSGSCSRVTPAAPFARLSPGNYTLTVGDYLDDEVIPAYELVVSARAVGTCGNGVRETVEQCDDGGDLPGDGCNAVCQWEGTPPVPELEPNGSSAAGAQPLGTLSAPAVVDVLGTIGVVGDEDWFSFTLTGSEHTSAVITTYGTFGDLGSCGFDTELWLYRSPPADLVALSPEIEPAIVAYDNNDGSGLCSQVSGTDLLPLPIDLTPGTYWVRVRAFHDAATIPQYLTRIDLR